MLQQGYCTRRRTCVFIAGFPRANFKSTSLINANSDPKSGCSMILPEPGYPTCRRDLGSTYGHSAGFYPYVRTYVRTYGHLDALENCR